MNATHASLGFGSHTKCFTTVHRRIEDMVHAQMKLENASYGEDLKTFYVVECNVRSIYVTCKGWSIKFNYQDLSLLDLLLF